MIPMGNLKVFVLMAGLTALLGALGGFIGGQAGLMIALAFAALMNVAMYWGSSRMVLRMYRARTVTPEEAPQLYAMVDTLRRRAGLPMPAVAIAPHAQPNAFATGRNPQNAVVCVTEGLLQLLSVDEVEGVVAHELAHIKNRDMLLQTVTATLAGAIGNLANFGLFFGGGDEDDNPLALIGVAILAPIAAMVVQMAISRQREFHADAVGAQICGRPHSLANALRRLESGAQAIPMQVAPSAAPLAMVNPLASLRGGGVARLFSTHPPTIDRVVRLEAMETVFAHRRAA
jgi:heat shock protein HtpX